VDAHAKESPDAAIEAPVDLHQIVTLVLGCVRQPISDAELMQLFWPSRRNTPAVFIGTIEPTGLEPSSTHS
jgi:hypothetical protein